MDFYKNEEEAKKAYDEYINGHVQNVKDAFELLATLDIPYVKENEDKLREICSVHDDSKWSDAEYFPYLHHFYPTNESEANNEEEFEAAVWHHVRNNRHHWNCKDWVDDENNLVSFDDEVYKLYVIERICDWLAMGYQHSEETPYQWWDENKDGMVMPDWAREMIEDILHKVPNDYELSFKVTRGDLDESVKVEYPKKPKEIIAHEYYNDDSYYVIDLKDGWVDPVGNNYIIEKSKKEAYKILKQCVKILDEATLNEGTEVEEKYKLFNKIKQYNPNAKYSNYENKSINQMLAILQKYSNKGTKTNEKGKEKLSNIKYGKNGEAYIRNDSGGYTKLDDDYFESFKVTRGGKGYLLEANMSQLKRTTLSEDPTRAKKSKNVQSKYLGISKYGVLNFETSSETHSGVKWYQEIQFPSFQGFMNIVENGDVIETVDVQKAMKSDNIKISCDDPSFLYWAWKYKAWKDVYGLEKETRAPKRNNTRLKGALCKHLYSVIELVNQKRILDLITRDLNQWCRNQLGMSDEGFQSPEMMDKEFKANQYDWDVAEYIKGLLSPENYEAYKNGTPLEDLDLTDDEIKDIEDAIKGMRDRSQFELKSELEKAIEPKKRGRKITRDDIKLSVGNEEEGEQ